MRAYFCPKCGAKIDRSRMPPRNLWNLTYTFRCQVCATMLSLDWEWPRWVAAVLMSGTLGTIGVGTLFGAFSGNCRNIAANVMFGIGALAASGALLYSVSLMQNDPRIHSDE